MKRMFDFLSAFCALLVLSPLFILISLAVRIKLGKPVLFRQIRSGQHGRPFMIYKFRSMTDEVGPDGLPLPDERRLGGFGQWLRRTSMDELPQLWNVLKGDLSLVGPRPLLTEYKELYNEEQAMRLVIKPGITGWAQVNGRNSVTWEEKFAMDVWYVRNASFVLDLKILLLTVKKTVISDGVQSEGYATMPVFQGSAVKEMPYE